MKTKTITIEVPLNVDEKDVQKMVNALSQFKGSEWWYGDFKKDCLSPLVMHNMKLGFEDGTLTPSMIQMNNLLKTALYYEALYRDLTK